MDRMLKTYLRTLRRRWGLTQKELAYLIGAKSGTVISRLERLKRLPNLPAALACLIVFDTSPPEVFPALFSEIEAAVLARAQDLYEELQGNPSNATRAKLDFLEKVLSRAQSKSDV